MKIKQYILFDLDGTLTDPYEGITKSAQYGLMKCGIQKTQQELKKIIGPPLKEAFMQFYSLDENDAEYALEMYRERFGQVGWQENMVYDGVSECLDALKKSGKKLIIATSKPIEFTEKILQHFNLLKYFDFVSASTLNGERNTKGKVISYAVKMMNITDISEAIMVGDRFYDIDGAKENNMDSIGVLYGYGSRKEFIDAGADIICESVKQLEQILL